MKISRIFKVALLAMVVLIIAPLSSAQHGPPKQEPGSKANPYYIKYDEPTSQQYIDMRFKFMEAIINEKMDAQEKAVNRAKEGMEKRLDGMNEFRDALKDQASRFVTRTELLAAVGFLAAFMFGLLQFMKRR